MALTAVLIPLMRTGPYLLLGAILAFFVFNRTWAFRQRAGVSPWHIHPAVWALITLLFSLIGTFGALIAMSTTKPRNAGWRRGMGPGGMGGPMAGRWGRGPFGGGPFGGGPYGRGPYPGGPYGRGPYPGGPYGRGPYPGGPFGRGPFGGAPGAGGPDAGGSTGPGVGSPGVGGSGAGGPGAGGPGAGGPGAGGPDAGPYGYGPGAGPGAFGGPGSGAGSSGSAPAGPGSGHVIDVDSTPVASPGANPPAWHADPSGRHQFRYWDGDTWTEHVMTEGVSAEDPLPH